MKNSQCLKFLSGLNEFFSPVKKIANFYPTKLSEIKFSILRHFMLSHLCWTFYQFWHCPAFAFNKLTFGNFVVFLKRFWEHKNFVKIGRNKKNDVCSIHCFASDSALPKIVEKIWSRIFIKKFDFKKWWNICRNEMISLCLIYFAW